MTRKSHSAHRISQQLSFAIYGAANRMARMHKPLLEPLGLTFPQYLVMLELYAGTPRSVGELGNALGMDTGTITPLLKRLESCGMVTRTRDVQDERRVLINLTSESEKIREEVWNTADSIKSACQLQEKDFAELRDALNNLAKS